MDKEALLSRMNDGRQASVLLQWIEPFFTDCQRSTIEGMKMLFRQGEYTEQVLACHVAQLIAIDDLRERIRGKMRTGDSAANQLGEDENGPGPESA